MKLDTNLKNYKKEEYININTFRSIHYLGSKLRVLDFLKEVIDEIDPDKRGVCDLFAGSGSVGQHLSDERNIVSVDVQEYSKVICSALLNPINDNITNNFINSLIESDEKIKYLNTFQEIIEYENDLIHNKFENNLELVCDFIENSSIYSNIINLSNLATPKLKQKLVKVIDKLNKLDKNSFLISKYFGGVFFSFKQAVLLDFIIDSINKQDNKYKNIFLAPLLSTTSDIVNTVGKQFAQPLRPRDKKGIPKKFIMNKFVKDRSMNVFKVYENWLNKYKDRPLQSSKHKVFKMDFRKALDSIDDDIKIIYADPPYTRDHYSRFYHCLETISLMDYPIVSKTNIGGYQKLSRGLYRHDRYQSDFCIKSKAPKAFTDLFNKASKKDKILLLSYSPYENKNNMHPRVVELDFLKNSAKKYFKKVKIISPGKFSHSKLNRKGLHLKSNEFSEILLVCHN